MSLFDFIFDKKKTEKQKEISLVVEFHEYCEYYGYEDSWQSMKDFLKRRKESPWMKPLKENL